jgi:hypothetical protein
MKKLVNYSIALLMGSIAIFSCRQRDVVAPTVVQQSNTPNGTHNYTIAFLVVPASTLGAKTEGVTGANVTISQGQNVQTATTGSDGIARFAGLNEGKVDYSISVSSTGGVNYASVSGRQDVVLTTNTFVKDNQSNQTGGLAVIIPLAPKAASLTGKILADFDFSSLTPVSGLAGVEVRLTYYFSEGYVIEPNYYIATTDASGNYTFANVPALNFIDQSPYNISADITIEKSIASGSNSVKFTGSRSLGTTDLAAGKSTDLGITQLNVVGINTSTITGVLYGDFLSMTSGNGGTLTFGPAVSNTDYVNQATIAGQALSTLPGFASSGFVRSGIVVKLKYSGLGNQITDYITTTDASGRYTFSNVPATGGGVSATIRVALQIPKLNPSTGISTQQTFDFASTPGVSVQPDAVQDFGPQKLQ